MPETKQMWKYGYVNSFTDLIQKLQTEENEVSNLVIYQDKRALHYTYSIRVKIDTKVEVIQQEDPIIKKNKWNILKEVFGCGLYKESKL